MCFVSENQIMYWTHNGERERGWGPLEERRALMVRENWEASHSDLKEEGGRVEAIIVQQALTWTF